ncbi:sulfate ABC transporter permease subunit CysT [Cellulomonas alba]|uniref:Sulfate transport system permease protein CysT n=1 Tax=Cellulomonas alba TaxID=3053467 RepID=A0ABT7SI93_9CELL|nr:sulfate ABC transporter permease subunit CysT [Cellulomonas alba]MDM7855885.1 sulfate ABC transporter permease subunit CysT [Cellulomonas alba]
MTTTLDPTGAATEVAAPVGVSGKGARRGRAARRRERTPDVADQQRRPLGVGSGTGLGVLVLFLSLVVLLPLAAVVLEAAGAGWGSFWDAITTPQAVRSLVFTVTASAIVTVVNAVMGTVIAWVLVRDEFPGKRLVELVIDIPFALPTIVAGLVVLAVYGRGGVVDLFATRGGVVVALLFVTLPFVVRAVQPVLIGLDRSREQAAATLGARPSTVFRRIVLPPLFPAIASGAALAFARAMGEYGSVLLISGGLAKTQVSSMYAYGLYEAYDFPGAAATATVLLVVSLAVLIGFELLQRRVARRG